jgi:hypothetical protein
VARAAAPFRSIDVRAFRDVTPVTRPFRSRINALSGAPRRWHVHR